MPSLEPREEDDCGNESQTVVWDQNIEARTFKSQEMQRGEIQNRKTKGGTYSPHRKNVYDIVGITPGSEIDGAI